MRSLKPGIFLCYFLVVLTGTFIAQVPGSYKFTTKDGLISDEVYNLHQDRRGYIWIFTNYGAQKYNGIEFKQVLKNLPFAESFIYCIYENTQGQKWVANSKGKIFEIIKDSAFVVKGTETVSELLRKNVSEIYNLYVDDSLNIYAITKRDSYKFIKSDDGYRPVAMRYRKTDSIAYRIFEKAGILFPVFNYKNDSAVCGGKTHLNIELTRNGKPMIFRLPCNLTGPKEIKRFGENIYFSYHNEIGKIRPDNTVSYVQVGSYILNFAKDKNGHAWVGTNGSGLYELDENDSIVHHYLKNEIINNILVDSQNGLWASSTSGLHHFSNVNNSYFEGTTPQGKPISFIKKSGDELLVGNMIGDILSIKANKIESIRNHVKEEEPLEALRIGSRYLFAFRYRIDQNGFYKDGAMPSLTNAYKIIYPHKDTLLFLQRKQISSLIKERLKIIPFSYKAYSFEYIRRELFIAMENGIWILKNDSLVQPDYLKPTLNLLINSISKDHLGNYWFCSVGNGIFKLNSNNKLTLYSIEDGLPTNIINNTCFNNNGDLLLATNKGLFFAGGTKGTLKSINWKRIYEGAVKNALFFENKIYLSTMQGLVVLDSDRIINEGQLHFNLSSIKINSTETDTSTFAMINHDENNLEFSFDLISFSSDKYQLVYNLYGPVRDSGQTLSRSLKFQKLSPGSYTLFVYPDVAEGKKIGLSREFTIKPAFWQTRTFFIVFTIFLILLIFYLGYLSYKFLKIREDRKNNAERLILEYKLIALKAQINPHFMSNCLTAIQHLIINNKVDQATAYVAKFGLLVRQILNFSTRSLVTLKEELEIASLNIELEQLRFEKKFLYEIKIQEGINVKDIFIPALILNPIIENAIWHGLLPLKNTRQGILKIEIKLENSTLLLIIEDNGAGRKLGVKNLSNTRESKGIGLTEQRLNNINYLFNITTSNLVYYDLVDEFSAPRGTRVVISLPINLTPLKNE